MPPEWSAQGRGLIPFSAQNVLYNRMPNGGLNTQSRVETVRPPEIVLIQKVFVLRD